MSERNGKTTIDDVAALAGVSIKTVSRVVNKEPNVSAGTRERVERAIAQLNYRPNPSARRLAGNRSYLIGLLYDNPSASYVINVQTGVLEACRAESYDLLIHPCTYTDASLPEEIVQLYRDSSLDGLILTPPLSDLAPLVKALRKEGVPSIRIAPAERIADTDAVRTNDRAACREMTEYLAALGHERIGFIIGHPDHAAVAARYSGYLEGMEVAGLRVSKRFVVQGYNSFESGIECAHQLLTRKRPPTAIFASNDDMAAGVMLVAHQMELAIPGDLSIVGFDDIPLARQLWPALTTIRQPVKLMAHAAASILIARLHNRSDEELPRTIDSTQVLRDSAGPVAG